MSWYSVPIYLRSSVKLPDGQILLEEAIHLIRASSTADAIAKGKRLATRLEHRYLNAAGRKVRWTVEDVGEPWELLDKLAANAELFSRFITLTELQGLRKRFPDGPGEKSQRKRNRGPGR